MDEKTGSAVNEAARDAFRLVGYSIKAAGSKRKITMLYEYA